MQWFWPLALRWMKTWSLEVLENAMEVKIVHLKIMLGPQGYRTACK